MKTRMFGLFIYILLLLMQLSFGSCPDGWMRHDSTCYHFSHDTEAMLVAKLSCQVLGGALLEIETAAENAYIAGYIKDKYSYYYIGLNDIQEEGVWVWVESSSSASYLNWRPNEPNSVGNDENCVVIDKNSGQWLDVACHNFFHYICEKKDGDAEIIG
ncbi:perlucin-like protein [Ruditapes philippinarum]|uniref:perlucin-like protein n=1 Tax=Ruditapes philippinarum TaxID=129788 RepID=UPI00295BBC77|nr:perlucin-like protein [Ruditapes philippinarum]